MFGPSPARAEHHAKRLIPVLDVDVDDGGGYGKENGEADD